MAREDNLKPFTSETGRLAGKKSSKKGIPHTKTRLKRILELEEQIKNPVTGKIEGFTIAEQMDLAIIAKARRGDIKAYQALLDRLEGKAQQPVDVTSGDMPISTVRVIYADDADELKRLSNTYSV